MQKTRIEWCKSPDGRLGWSSNPVKGYCPMDCKDKQGKSYCYARRLYDRYGWDKTIRFDPDELATWGKAKPGDKVFVGSTIELFGEWVNTEWLELILTKVRYCPKVTFIFLSKLPVRLNIWFRWPDNCWVGATATNYSMAVQAQKSLLSVSDNVVKFLSLEPLQEAIPGDDWLVGIDLIIIGAQTQPLVLPKLEWVEEIEQSADQLGIPVFEKNSLSKLLQRPLRQEYPKYTLTDKGREYAVPH